MQGQTSLFAANCLYSQQLQREAKKDQARVSLHLSVLGLMHKMFSELFLP